MDQRPQDQATPREPWRPQRLDLEAEPELARERPRFRGLGREGWAALSALLLLFGVSPLLLGLLPSERKYAPAQLTQIDATWAQLHAARSRPTTPSGLVVLEEVASGLALHPGRITLQPGSVLGAAAAASGPSAGLLIDDPVESQTRELLLAHLLSWHRSVPTHRASSLPEDTLPFTMLALELHAVHAEDLEVQAALLHLAQDLRQVPTEGFAAAGWRMAELVLTPHRSAKLPSELTDFQPTQEQFTRDLLSTAQVLDQLLEQTLNEPPVWTELRARFLGERTAERKDGASILLQQRLELRELTAELHSDLQESWGTPPERLLAAVDVHASRRHSVAAEALLVSLRELALAARGAWQSGHVLEAQR